MALSNGNDSRVAAIDDMITKYSVGLRGCPAPRPAGKATPSPLVALLTGSTGGLGSQMLVEMVENDRFTKIYAFNRPSSQPIFERHKTTFDDRGLDTSLLTHPKIVYICGDTSQASLGLTPDLYEEIRSSVTLIIHNAWTIGFTQPLALFEENIQGTRHLIDFALSSPHYSSLRFIFISSILSALGWKHEYGPLPEEIILDSRVGVGVGYGESKYVTERILALSGLQSCSIRVSQISGSAPKGAWSTSEWFPLLLKTSINLQCFPMSRGVVSWIPMNVAACSIIDVALATSRESVLNLVHPRPIPAASLAEMVDRELSEREPRSPAIQYPLVPGNVWISRLMKRFKQTSGPQRKNIVSHLIALERQVPTVVQPIIEIIDYAIQTFQAELAVLDASHEAAGIPVASTDRIQLLSPSLRGAKQIGRSDVQSWLNYWESIGFLERTSDLSTFAKL